MFLTRLVYFSKSAPAHEIDVEQILRTARTYNKRNHITGALWFDGDFFVQVLEGGRHAVSHTYHRIASDPRHFDIELAVCEGVDTRLFHAWHMAYFADTENNRNLVLKYSGQDKLDPARMTASSLLHLLAEGQLLGE